MTKKKKLPKILNFFAREDTKILSTLFWSFLSICCSIHVAFQHEDEKKTMARERLRDRTYSESFTSHRPPKCKPGRPRPRNGEQPSTNKVPISIDAATLPWLKRRSNFNDFSQPSKQKKTCQDTNTEGLKVSLLGFWAA